MDVVEVEVVGIGGEGSGSELDVIVSEVVGVWSEGVVVGGRLTVEGLGARANLLGHERFSCNVDPHVKQVHI